MCVSVLDVSNGFKGYLGPVADAFGLQASTADKLLIVTSLYLLIGCIVARQVESGQKVAKGIDKPTAKAT